MTYDILYDILIKQNGDIHSDWTGVLLDVDAYTGGFNLQIAWSTGRAAGLAAAAEAQELS